MTKLLTAFDRMVTEVESRSFYPLEHFIRMAEVDDNVVRAQQEFGTKSHYLTMNDGSAAVRFP